MKHNSIPDRFVLAYIAARRTESSLNRTRALAREWRDQVSTASQEGDDMLAVQALQQAQRYHATVADLYDLLADQEDEVARLQFDYAVAD